MINKIGVNMILKRLLLRMFLILMAFSIVFAEEKKSLTLEECIEIGLKNSKTLNISKSKVEAAQEKSKEVDAGMLPALKFAGGYTRLSPIDPFSINMPGIGSYTLSPSILNNYTAKLSLIQPIYTGSRLSSNSDLIENLANATVEDLNQSKSQLILDIKNSYWTLYKSIDFLKIIEENITQIRAHLDDIQNMYNSGMATNNDVLKVKVQLSNIEITKIDAENNIALSRLALNNTIGLPLYTSFDLKSKIDVKSDNYSDMKNLIDKAINERPELKAMDFRIKSSQAGVEMAKSGFFPQINFIANYNYNRPNQRIFPSVDEFRGTWDISLMLSYDIWTWQTTSHQKAQAEAALDQSNIAMEQLKDAVTLDVSQSYLNLIKSREKITVSDESVKQAEENYRVTNEKFKAGLALNSDLIDAESALLTAKINYTSSLADYEIAIARLEKAISK
jgi:outer membrane protein